MRLFLLADSAPHLQGNVFIVRYNSPITEAPGGAQRTLTYADLVAVNVTNGSVQRIAAGFANPLAVLADDRSGRLLIADYVAQIVYTLQYVPQCASSSPAHEISSSRLRRD